MALFPLEAALRSSDSSLISLFVKKKGGSGGGGAGAGAPALLGGAAGGTQTLLHVAAEMGDVAHCRLLLTHAAQLGLDANAADEDSGGSAPLHFADFFHPAF